jgi:colanic acid biosynthesis glycosyl transferase WcaI
MERIQYRVSRRLVVLGDASRATLVNKGVNADRIEVIPVWLDPEEIRPGPRDNRWRAEQGIGPDRFVVLYSGTSGIISGAEMLADVAARLPPEVVLLVVGGGEAWRRLDALVRAGTAPPNLILRPYQPRERLAEVQASSDLSLVTLLPGKGRTSVPSKVQGYMAAGRPVLAAVDADCDTAGLVSRGGFGLVVPFSATDLVRAIEEVRAQPRRLAEWGQRARQVFEQEHAREPIIARYHRLLEAVVADSPRRSP